METPKPKGGRPRRRPFAAHDARRARTYLNRAARELQALRWELQRNDEVLRYLYVERKRDLQWAMEVARPLEETLKRLMSVLDARPAPAEDQADV
jgi:hypothetical protein